MAKDTNQAGLDAKQQATLRQLLVAARAELTKRRLDKLERQGALRSEVEDEGDSASRADNEDTLITLAESELDRVGEIDRALAKFDSGEYGLDEETGEPIGFERLQLIPWARYSAATQEALER